MEKIQQLLDDKEDVFVRVSRYEKCQQSTQQNETEWTIRKYEENEMQNTGEKSARIINTQTETKQTIGDARLYQVLSNAKKMQSNGMLRKARDMYLETLKEKEMHDVRIMLMQQIAHEQLGVIYLMSKKHSDSIKHFREALAKIQFFAKQGNALPDRNFNENLPLLFALLGQALFQSNEYKEALTCFRKCVQIIQKKPYSNIGGEEQKKHDIRNVRVWEARTLHKLATTNIGNLPANNRIRQEAIAIYEQIIKENEHHVSALTHYASLAVEVGQGIQAIPYLLRALVHMHTKGKEQQNSPYAGICKDTTTFVQQLLATVVMQQSGLQGLFMELHNALDSPAALTFLAQTLKDQGAISASIGLYSRALLCNHLPLDTQINIILCLAHTQEVAYQYQEAFETIRCFLSANKSFKLNEKETIEPFYQVIERLQDLYDPRLRSGTYPDAPKYASMPIILDAGRCQVPQPSIDDLSAVEVAKNGYLKSSEYSTAQLDMLGLLMTCVKLLFICGALQVIPSLCQFLEPLRCNKNLHLTLIRNEHAYYSCISQVISFIKFPIAMPKIRIPEDIVYFCGDSHSLSSAWQMSMINNRLRLIQPKLVTGLKCWHLRPNCCFYPKRNFEAATQTIPAGSTVIFCFGEIDCREGIIVAVEKCLYETIDEGIDVCIDIYINALEEIVRQKRFKAFVHPIVPVLDVTRPMVMHFTQRLKEKIANNQSLIYLDFFEDLLVNGNEFNMAFALDGTHMSPAYLPLLQNALSLGLELRKQRKYKRMQKPEMQQ